MKSPEVNTKLNRITEWITSDSSPNHHLKYQTVQEWPVYNSNQFCKLPTLFMGGNG
jgi:hypothetical protein